MSEAAAASAYGAQPTTAPINLVSDSQNQTAEPAPHEEAWGLDYGIPGETIEVPDQEGQEFSSGVEIDETAKNKPQNQKKPQQNQGAAQAKEQAKEPELTVEQQLQRYKEQEKNFKRGIYEKFQEAAQIRKEALLEKQQLLQIKEKLRQKAMDNPLGLLDLAGVPPEMKVQVLERAAMELQAELQKTPEQRELEELKKFKEGTLKQQEEHQKQFQQQQEKIQIQQLQEGLSGFIIDAFNKRVGLPATPERVRQMAMALGDYYDAGQPVDIERVADEVWDGFRTDVQRSLAKLREKSPEKLIEIIGEDNAKAIAAQLGQKFAANQHFKNHSKPKPPSAPNHEEQPQWLGYSDVEEMRRKGRI